MNVDTQEPASDSMDVSMSVVDQEVERLTALFLKQLRHSHGDRVVYERSDVHVTFNSFLRLAAVSKPLATRIRDRVLETITLSEAMPA